MNQEQNHEPNHSLNHEQNHKQNQEQNHEPSTINQGLTLSTIRSSSDLELWSGYDSSLTMFSMNMVDYPVFPFLLST